MALVWFRTIHLPKCNHLVNVLVGFDQVDRQFTQRSGARITKLTRDPRLHRLQVR